MKPTAPSTNNPDNMRRRNFYLPDKLMSELETLAKKRGESVATVVRQALHFYLRHHNG